MIAPISPTISLAAMGAAAASVTGGEPDAGGTAPIEPISNDPITEIRLLVAFTASLGQTVDAQA